MLRCSMCWKKLMTTVDHWQLPDGVEEVLPAQAALVERLRRQLLDLYRSWGYRLVIPPLVESTTLFLVVAGCRRCRGSSLRRSGVSTNFRKFLFL